MRCNLNLSIRCGHRNYLGVTRRNQTSPESGPKLDHFLCSHENGTVRYRIVPISGSLFPTVQFLDLFLERTAWFFSVPVQWTQPLSVPVFGTTEVERYDIVPVWPGSYVTREVLHQMYKLYVRPYLDYGDIIYHKYCPHMVLDFTKKLEATQYVAVLAVSGP